jgi:DNA-binding transcriptional LysR family regulator
VLGRFHRSHPEVEIRLFATAGGSRALVEALTTGRLDLALVSLPDAAPPGVIAREVARSPLDLVVPDGHRLAGQDTVALHELAGEPFVEFPLGYGNRVIVDRAFAAARTPRRVVLEITDIAMAADCVRHGLGVAILPRFVIGDDLRLHRLAITGPTLTWPMFVTSPANRPLGAAARALLELLLPHGPELV